MLDLPGDGSNITSNNKDSFQHWHQALIEAISQFKDVILVAHSTGGMYALSSPELENLLKGLVLLNSAPDAQWQKSYSEMCRNRPIDNFDTLAEKYHKRPSNETLKKLTIASAPYLFTQKGMAVGIEMLKTLPYNYEACQWSDAHFDRTYHAAWTPQTIPTLLLTGDSDQIISLKFFKDSKQFHRNNIVIKAISGAGHFPWIDNPDEVALEFKKFSNQFE